MPSKNLAEDHGQQRVIIQRRLRDVGERFALPRLSRRRMQRLSNAVAGTLGEDGVSDADLRVVYKLTARGLLDNL